MELEKLGSSLRASLRRIARAGYIDKETLDNIIKELQRALLSADVNVKLVLKMSENIEKRAWKEEPKPGLSKREHVLNVVYEELLNILGGESKALEIKEKGKIMLVGLFGSGKTITCAKLGKYLTKKGLKVLLVCTDIWRPAAFEQLKQLGEETNIPVYGNPKEKNPIKILKEGLKKGKDFDVVIVDSAGRDALNKELIGELKKMNKLLKAEEKLLVMPADFGQKAGEQAKAFENAIGLTGVIVTKLDSSAKGGGALSACASVGIPIKFAGVGEKISDFDEFDSTRFVSKLLGMGDLESLVKKTQEIFKEAPKEDMEKLMKGKFTLKDLYVQIQSMHKIGPLQKILEMLPMGVEIPKDQIQLSEERINKFLTVMDSMTNEELEEPDLLNKSRIERVAQGSGSKVEDVRSLIKQYNISKKMIKKFGKLGKNKRSMEKLMKFFKGFKGV